MFRKLSVIFLMSAMALVGFAKDLTNVDCGTWIEIWAKPYPDYHFVQWSDGNKDSVRQIQVEETRTYIAYFAPNCGDYAALPVVALYDWLLMIDNRAIKDKGYYFTENDVTWYRVVGEVDSLNAPHPNDEVVCKGYYLTLAKNLIGTGDYYAVIDVSSSPSGLLCTDLMRSVIISFAPTSRQQQPFLTPTRANVGESLTLHNLNPSEQTLIQVYDMVGQLMETFTSVGEASFLLTATRVAGCYNVLVTSPSTKTTLRYIVNNQ